MADTQLTGQISDAIKQTLGFKDKSLVSRPEWGTIKFTNAEKDLERIFSLLSYLSILPLEYLTDQAANQIKAQIDQTRPRLEQIDKFNIEQPNAPQTRDALISQIHQAADALYTAAAALWCGKIYKALMHQSAVNRHRALSLQTFQAFSSAASDVQTKDTVLLETTRSIFSQCMTGYVDSASTAAVSDVRVIEIVKSIAQKH